MTLRFGPRRGTYLDATDLLARGPAPLTAEERAPFETLDLVYRSLCALLFNYVPTSGHPGGSISSGRFVAALLFDALDYDLPPHPRRADAARRALRRPGARRAPDAGDAVRAPGDRRLRRRLRQLHRARPRRARLLGRRRAARAHRRGRGRAHARPRRGGPRPGR